MKLNNHINYFDILKTLSIICVIYLHYPWISTSSFSNVSMLISLIAVPIFFMVNGALLLNKELNLKKHYKKMLIFLFSLIIWKALILILCIIFDIVDFSSLKLYEVVLSLFSNYNIKGVPTEHLWFMYSLIKLYFVVPFLSLFISKYKKYLKYMIVICLIFTFGFELIDFIFIALQKIFNLEYLNFKLINLDFNPMSESRTITYFLIGYYLHEKYYNKEIKFSNRILLLIFFTLGLFMLIFVRYIQTGNLLSGPYVRLNNDYTKVGTLLMATSIFAFFATLKLNYNKYLNYISSRTINIYYIHMFIAKILVIYLHPLMNIYGTKANIIKTFIIFILSIIVTELLKKIKIIKRVLNLS